MRRLDALENTYARIDREHAAFRQSAAGRGKTVACPPRCGNCCIHFVPDVVPIEADRIAFLLLTERPAMIDHFFAHREESYARDAACPFWDESKPGENCRVYSGRPLICRLFGFSSMLNKAGEPAFALCHGMAPVPGEEARLFAGEAEMTGLFGAVPPPMADFSAEIVAIDPSEAGLRASILDALPSALARVALVLKLGAEEVVPDSDRPSAEPMAAS
jgi:Fe-S-cluster containining protein